MNADVRGLKAVPDWHSSIDLGYSAGLRFFRVSRFWFALSPIRVYPRKSAVELALANCQLLFASCFFPPRLRQVHQIASHVSCAQRAGEWAFTFAGEQHYRGVPVR